MDFGDILNKWERDSRSSANGENDAMETWQKDNGTENDRAGERRRRLLAKKPDDILDIHGMNAEEALLSLDVFFSKAKESGFEKLRVIHGKGNHSEGEAVLGRTVRDFIEQCSYAGESGYEKSANGGSGSTWVFLK